MQQQIRFCTSADGTRIAYATSGAGPALLLTTSWVNHLQYAAQMPPWNCWIEALSSEYSLLRYDARGCGLSDRSVRNFSLEASVADMEAVVAASGVKRFAILGVCSGGPPAIVYGVRHPQQVTGLVLYGTWGRGRFRRPEQPHEGEKARVLIEMARLGWAQEDHTFLNAWASVFQPGGTPDHRRGWCTLQKASTFVNDIWLMRKLPAMVAHAGFRTVRFDSHGYIESAEPTYLLTVVDRGVDSLMKADVVGRPLADALKGEARRRVEKGQFFGHIAYASLPAQKPTGGHHAH